MVLVVLFALGLVTVAELWVILQIGHAIGALATIGLMVADAAIGSAIMRAQGRLAWRRFRDAFRAGHVPAREALDGTLVVVGGALLITPGFITDILGLVLLVPASRTIVRRVLVRRMASRLTAHGTSRRPSASERRPADLEGTAHDSAGAPPVGP